MSALDVHHHERGSRTMNSQADPPPPMWTVNILLGDGRTLAYPIEAATADEAIATCQSMWPNERVMNAIPLDRRVYEARRHLRPDSPRPGSRR